MSDVFCILFNSISFEAIIVFSSCGLLLSVSHYTSVFVKSIQEIREAIEPSQMGRSRSLLAHSSVPNLGSNPPERESRQGLEKLMKFGIKALLGVALALFSVGVVDIVATPLDTLMKVQNPEVYKLNWYTFLPI
jgi:hypothetical protein